MEIDLSGRVVLVTGAGRGIGRALAGGLAAEGARVAVLDLRADHAEATAREITEIAGAPGAVALEADVGDEPSVEEAIARIDRTWGRLDAVVNCAAWIPPRRAVVEEDPASLERVFRTNVVGSFLVTKHAAPVMVRAGGGRIIYMSSGIGVAANPGQAAYGGSKAAINILAQVAHQELSDGGIRTVALAPGLTESPGMRESLGDAYADRVAAAYPKHRLGQPEDIVALTVFLCSDAAHHLSGTVITVRPPAQ